MSDCDDGGVGLLTLDGSQAPYPRQTDRYKLVHGDAFEFLGGLEPDSVDLVITDPPYESLEKHRKVGTTTRLKHSKASSNNWFPVMPNDRFLELFTEIYRVLRDNTHLYMFCDQETAFYAKPIAEHVGLRLAKPLVWDKQTIGMGYHYRARYEFILFFEKGDRKLTDLGAADVLTAKRVRHKDAYPTEKPVSINRTLITQSTEVGQLVLDPFMGSGSAGVAAMETGRRFLGCDIMAASMEMAERKIYEAHQRPWYSEEVKEP